MKNHNPKEDNTNHPSSMRVSIYNGKSCLNHSININNYDYLIFDSTKGINKSSNEDDFIVINTSKNLVAMVADGVGTAIGSHNAVNFTKAYIHTWFKRNKNTSIYDTDLTNLLFELNNNLLQKSYIQPYTTCCVIIYQKETSELKFASIGDSRVYAIGSHYIKQLTKDHKLEGQDHVITHCLGMPNLKLEDINNGHYKKSKDKILLCTDGFYNVMNNNLSSFFDTFLRNDLKRMHKNLIQHTNNKNIDDCTYILF